ncbi:MAG: DUF222 domain-containing protein [Deltaproteobacteria bacterium]|nr:DUF222 domain-containing protein [Deltaproteobacteria bacterium]
MNTAALADLSNVDLESELTTLAAHIQAATARLLALLAEIDRREAWGSSGALSCAHWLAFRTGLDLGAAREHVRVARALTVLPQISAAFGRGELSYSKVRAITRIARPETEADLLAMAREGTTAHIERLVRACRRADPAAENATALAQQEARWLHTRWTDDGMLLVEGRLTPEQGALLQRALEVVMREQEREAGSDPLPAMAQRQADALAQVADRALGGAGRSGGDRVQVVVHVDAEVLADPAADGRSELEDGPRVSAETSRRLACDCSVVELRHGSGDEVAAGRKTRVISAPLRRALRARDGGCVFPGCTNRRCDGHHVRHWAEGGGTTLDNTCLVCDRHHTWVHEGGWRMERSNGRWRFFRPDGSELVAGHPRLGATPVADLCGAQTGLHLTPDSLLPAWDGSPIDLEWGGRVLRCFEAPVQ